LIPFDVTGIFYGQNPGVGPTSDRCEYHVYFLGCKGGRGLGLTTLPPSCAECLEIWKRQLPGTLGVLSRGMVVVGCEVVATGNCVGYRGRI
jgi:hypothetical protein